MPGPTITNLLQPNTYENFQRVAHDYSELLLSAAVFIRPSSAIILHQLAVIPISAFDDKITAPTLERTLNELAERGQDLSAQIRSVFWNYEPNRRIFHDETALAKNKERWKPYNEAAWDRFFVEVADRLTPILQRLSDLRSPLRLLAKWPQSNGLELTDDTVKVADVAVIESIRHNLERTVDRLQALLDADVLDTIYAETA